jgi:hypothetical protein
MTEVGTGARITLSCPGPLGVLITGCFTSPTSPTCAATGLAQVTTGSCLCAWTPTALSKEVPVAAALVLEARCEC